MQIKFVKILSFFAGLAMMLTTQITHARPVTSAEELLDRCRGEGSAALVRDLTKDDDDEWRAVIAQIRTGDPEWVYASGCLTNGIYFGGNASAWIDLEVTWAELLAKAPREVLWLEGRGVSIMKACGMPFIEPEKEFIENHVKAVLEALATVEEESLQYARRSCEARLRDSYERGCYIEDGDWVCPSR